MQGYFAIRLQGGLGNQMFQYALGRALSLRQGVPLRLDLSAFEHDKRRPYMLNVFEIKAQALSQSQGRHLNAMEAEQNMALRAVRKLGRRLLPSVFPKNILQTRRGFMPELLDLKPSAYFKGYWQSEKYFMDCRAQLLEDFTMGQPATGQNAEKNLEIARQIQAGPSVSLHVRRGDYISSDTANALFGTCSIDYYKRALAMVAASVPNLTVYIFSDDPQWTRENICPDLAAVYVNHNSPEQGHLDMHLMSLCNHNITANSTFSWWGAWLNRHEDKIVCCPDKWYSDEAHANPDIYPDGWHRL